MGQCREVAEMYGFKRDCCGSCHEDDEVYGYELCHHTDATGKEWFVCCRVMGQANEAKEKAAEAAKRNGGREVSKYCDDCGTKYADGCCPNCHEELFIEKTQGEFMEEVSDEWREKVTAQKHQLARASKVMTKP